MKYTQRERTICKKAATWLHDEVSRRDGVVACKHWIEREVKESHKHGRGRADAVVAALMQDGTVYTIVVEAKSMRTRYSLRREAGCVAQFLTAILLASALGFGAWWWIGGPWGAAAAIACLILIGLSMFSILATMNVFPKGAAVIAQVRQYPGNERWIAVSEDALQHVLTDRNSLAADCSRAKVGLLGIGRRREARAYVVAEPHEDPGDKLREYVRAEEMLDELYKSVKGVASPGGADDSEIKPTSIASRLPNKAMQQTSTKPRSARQRARG